MAFVDGMVVPRATRVRITLASGAMVQTSAVYAPAPLSQEVKYFVRRIPCGSHVASLIGLDSGGNTVARFTGLH